MNLELTKREKEIFDVLSKSAGDLQVEAYVIGGFVRDKILERSTKDIDIVSIGSGIEFANKVSEYFDPKPSISIFKRFGTAMLKLEDLELEFVGARKESYRSDSRKPTVEEGTLEDDQNRRDFTINVLAIQLHGTNKGKLIDPFGGVEDLNNKILRTPLEPGITFSDDPLRMMRAIRFATQLGFEIEANTFRAISENAKRIQIISKERIIDELNKIILSDKPSIGFRLLDQSGLLEIILPEIANLKGVDIVNGQGHKDNFDHTLKVLDNLAIKSDDLWLRWAALLHDVGKPKTKKFIESIGWTFYGHDVVGERMTVKIFKRMKLPLDNKLTYVMKMVRLHLRPISLTKENISDSAIRRLIYDADEDLDDLLKLCEADITSKNENKVKRYLENYRMVRDRIGIVEERDHIRNFQPPISGNLIIETLGIPPSKVIGDIKSAIKNAILDGKIPNDYQAAYNFMLDLAKEMNLDAD